VGVVEDWGREPEGLRGCRTCVCASECKIGALSYEGVWGW